jgi:ribonuclease VapC
MVIDTSGLLAIVLDEPERRGFNEALEAATSRVMSVANLLEVSIVIESRFGTDASEIWTRSSTERASSWRR